MASSGEMGRRTPWGPVTNCKRSKEEKYFRDELREKVNKKQIAKVAGVMNILSMQVKLLL